jgi:glycosyltransferase involved in cell wall biosynthesis
MNPTTDHPRRIAFLGWAQLSLQERQGTGYNFYASELATGLAARGHRVSYLRSGLDYRIGMQMRIEPFETWRGVECHHFFNSPNVSPAAENFRNMAAESQSPGATRVVLDWLDRIHAEIVHVHSLEGLSLDLLPAIRASGRAVVVTPHNYWYVCPQVDLLYQERDLCDDYQGGLRCVDCVPARDPALVRRRRALRQAADATLGAGFVPAFRARVAKLRAQLRPSPPRGSDPAEAAPADLFRGFTPASDGTFDHGLRVAAWEAPPELGASPIDANERFLAAKCHDTGVNEYGARRAAGVEALNQTSAILAPSDFLRRAHAAMGVDERRLRSLPYGSPHFDRIRRRAIASPFYDARPWDPQTATRPLRFAFHGTTRNNKGLLWLMRAIPLLDTAIRQRCQFGIRAAGWDWTLRKLMSPYPEVQFLGGYDALQLLAAGGDYEVGIMTHVWFDNLPLVMLEHLHAGKFVVSSRLGGPADWIVEPKNGMLFAAGHPDELAACITRIVRGDVPLPSPREIHAASPLPSFPEHVSAVESVYEEMRETS